MREYRSVVVSRPTCIEPQHVDEYYWAKPSGSVTVFTDDTPRKTGLLDQYGSAIVAVETVGPIGFGKL
jgi:hypothetical protein